MQRAAALTAGIVLLIGAHGMQAGKRARPTDGSSSTTKCKDGSYTKAKNPEKGCKKHGGVAPKS